MLVRAVRRRPDDFNAQNLTWAAAAAAGGGRSTPDLFDVVAEAAEKRLASANAGTKKNMCVYINVYIYVYIYIYIYIYTCIYIQIGFTRASSSSNIILTNQPLAVEPVNTPTTRTVGP